MARAVRETIEVNAPLEACFRAWADCSTLPRFLDNVKRIEPRGEHRWHWQVEGPDGETYEYDAEVDGLDSNSCLAWRSLENSPIDSRGTVQFIGKPANHQTRVEVVMIFEPKADLVDDVGNTGSVAQQLQRFKSLVERQALSGAA